MVMFKMYMYNITYQRNDWAVAVELLEIKETTVSYYSFS